MQPFLEGKQVVKVIVVPDKLVNIVVKGLSARLLPDDHFPQAFPRQKELHRFEFLKQLLQAAVIE